MKNTIKMSLAAAVAVSAFSTSAFAGNLEEMIKGVDVSGYVDYRLENRSTESNTGAANSISENLNEYSVNVTVNTKVNDIVSATVSAGFDEVQTANTQSAMGAPISRATTYVAQDASAPVGVDQAYFTFAMGNTTVMAGKQNIPSVFVDQKDTVKQGAGIVAMHKFSDAITIAGAHFMNNNIAGATDTKTSELIAMGSVGPVNYSVNYNMTDVNNAAVVRESDRYSIAIGATLGPVKVNARHTAASTDNVGLVQYEDAEVTKIGVSGKVGPVSLSALYAFTNEQNGVKTSTDVAIDGDNDADVHAKVWQLSTSATSGALGTTRSDADIFVVGASMPLMDKLTAGITYGTADYVSGYTAGIADTDAEADELLFTLTYKMSKNFTIHGRYSILDVEQTAKLVTGATTDTTAEYSRIQVKYTF